MAFVTPQTTASAILTALKGAGGTYNGAKLHLFKNNITPDVQTALADLEECDFDGYAASAAVTWGSVIHAGADSVQIASDAKEFVATGGTTPNNIYGWYVTDGAGTGYLGAERFDEPIPVVEAGNGLSLQAVLILPSDVFV